MQEHVPKERGRRKPPCVAQAFLVCGGRGQASQGGIIAGWLMPHPAAADYWYSTKPGQHDASLRPGAAMYAAMRSTLTCAAACSSNQRKRLRSGRATAAHAWQRSTRWAACQAPFFTRAPQHHCMSVRAASIAHFEPAAVPSCITGRHIHGCASTSNMPAAKATCLAHVGARSEPCLACCTWKPVLASYRPLLVPRRCWPLVDAALHALATAHWLAAGRCCMQYYRAVLPYMRNLLSQLPTRCMGGQPLLVISCSASVQQHIMTLLY